jgi:predicted alpha/beta hydrolase family esterase
MKTAWLLHGTGGSDNDYFWFEDTKVFLESKGYSVWWPLLPNTEKPNLENTRNYIEENMPVIDKETIIIGHSSACPVILTFLQNVKVHVKQFYGRKP